MISKLSTKSASARRWGNPLMLVLSSFAAGAVFGGTIVQFHSDSLSLALSRIVVSIQDDLLDSPSMASSSLEDCHSETNEKLHGGINISEMCEKHNYTKRDLLDSDNLDVPKICESNNYVKRVESKEVAINDQSPKLRTEYAGMLRQTNGMEPTKTATRTATGTARTARGTTKTYSYKPTGRNANWCPAATCKSTELCHPCQRRFLILITTARSASTTLTWMLDALPGVRMSGENANTLAFLKKLMDNVLKNQNFKESAGKKASWGHHLVPPQSLSCVSQAMIEGINPPPLVNSLYIKNATAAANDIVGFKTIRFFHEAETVEDEKEIVLFLRENFPCSKVIVNINSNIDQYVESVKKAWKSTTSEKNYAEVIQKQNEQLRKVVAWLGPQRAFLLDKNEWTQNITKVNEAVSWLGFDPACHFTELLEFHTKGGGYGNSKTSLAGFSPKCKRLD